jgi:hypothetical protein
VKYAILTAYPAITFQRILLIDVPLRPPKDIFFTETIITKFYMDSIGEAVFVINAYLRMIDIFLR